MSKNKGMHQQPNAFTPSTGQSAPMGKNMNKGGFNTPQAGTPGQQNWNRAPQTGTSTENTHKGFNKGGKKAA